VSGICGKKAALATPTLALAAASGRYVHLPDSHQKVSTLSVGYTLLGHQKFGAVEWRQ